MTFGRIFLFILAFSLLEVMVLAFVAGHIGWPITIILTVSTALLGSYLFRTQGLETWGRINQRMQQGEMPGQEMAEAVMLMIGGAVLITPGFITDAIGLALLLPMTRKKMAQVIIARGMLQTMGQGGGVFYQQDFRPGGPSPFQQPPHNAPHRRDNVTIEGEAKRTEDEEKER